MTWEEDRLSEFADMLAEWPTVTITNNGQSAVVIKTPTQKEKEMQKGPYALERTSIFDIKRTDSVLLALSERGSFLCESLTYQINRIEDDGVDPIIKLHAVKKS